jgi:hypothetical protein
LGMSVLRDDVLNGKSVLVYSATADSLVAACHPDA